MYFFIYLLVTRDLQLATKKEVFAFTIYWAIKRLRYDVCCQQSNKPDFGQKLHHT